MSQKSVYCISTSRHQAEHIVDQLKAANFSSEDISALFSDKDSAQEFAHEKHTKAPEGAVAGVSTGGVVGGALGWIAGIGALAIPGVGPFIAAGPILAALSGAAIGATVGGIAGGLIGMGIPELTPISPPSGPDHWLFQGPPAESKFLAAAESKFLAANPHFPALRSGPMALSGASRRKQIPCSH